MGFQTKPTRKLNTAVNHIGNTDDEGDSLAAYYLRVRNETEDICVPLVTEDYGIQTVPEVSPPKWHLAHTSWFFETLLLKPFLDNYKEYHPQFGTLFNSYYDTIGEYHPRPERGLLSRPTVEEVYAYRKYIDEYMGILLADDKHPQQQEIQARSRLGINHEQQHQELMLTDIKHIFAYSPLKPKYKTESVKIIRNTKPSSLSWKRFNAGLYETGTETKQFAYDNESPRHKSYLEQFEIADRLVTNGEYLEFMDSGAYQNPDYWLSDAWKIINTEHWQAPLYWEKIAHEWWYMTLSGMQRVDPDAPVCHVSFYEAAAYARWKNVRLPTESEWEVVASEAEIKGNFRESWSLQPRSITSEKNENDVQQLFGDVWEWTQSPYVSYPGYVQQHGAFGEYNGKFMSSQMVLRGGSCATPVDHMRKTYRNFFYPHERWQFMGIRLARDVE